MSGPIDQPPRDQARPRSFGPVVFDRYSAEQTRESVEYTRQVRRSGPTPPSRQSWTPVNPGLYMQATSTITAASGLTLGSGTAQICSKSGVTLTADGITVTVYNAVGSVPSGIVFAAAWVAGDWLVAVAPC